MADNWASWYSGGMTPPLALPGGGYVPAPLAPPQMSVDEMYRGIYAPPAVPQSLQTRSVQTVQIDPRTGTPVSSSPMLSVAPPRATPEIGTERLALGNLAGSGRLSGSGANYPDYTLPGAFASPPRLPMSATANAALGAIGRATGSMYATAPNQPAG